MARTKKASWKRAARKVNPQLVVSSRRSTADDEGNLGALLMFAVMNVERLLDGISGDRGAGELVRQAARCLAGDLQRARAAYRAAGSEGDNQNRLVVSPGALRFQ